MSTYKHFGKQPDVLKHLVLCEILQNENPSTYVETNSACAIYQMEHTPEQQYGIYHFLERANDENGLKDSMYYKLEKSEMQKGNYLGSPGLAMNVLKGVNDFIFFDIEKSALDNVSSYAGQIKIHSDVRLLNTDSLNGMIDLLPTLPKSTFIHIDPYEIDKKGASDLTYLDIFVKATQSGMKCLLWYGFMTNQDKGRINQYVIRSLQQENIKNYTCVELIMKSIKENTVSCNPGVLGSGILAANLSQKSRNMILDYSRKLVELYKNAQYNGYDGSLSKDIVKNVSRRNSFKFRL